MSVPVSTATIMPPLPEGVREGNENLVRLTHDAGAKVAALVAREQAGAYLRIAIAGGGCNGLSYKLRFTPELRRGDILVRTAGVPVAVGPQDRPLSQGHSAGLFVQTGRRRLQILQPQCQGVLLLRGEFQRLIRGRFPSEIIDVVIPGLTRKNSADLPDQQSHLLNGTILSPARRPPSL